MICDWSNLLWSYGTRFHQLAGIDSSALVIKYACNPLLLMGWNNMSDEMHVNTECHPTKFLSQIFFPTVTLTHEKLLLKWFHLYLFILIIEYHVVSLYHDKILRFTTMQFLYNILLVFAASCIFPSLLSLLRASLHRPSFHRYSTFFQ